MRPDLSSSILAAVEIAVTDEYPESRQERRDKKQQAEREKMAKHGKSLAQMYKDALLKRLGMIKNRPNG